MYAITGITGQVGSVLGENLLVAQEHVRAVVRDANKGKAWKDRGCELAHATIEDMASLTAAFQGMEAFLFLSRQTLIRNQDFLRRKRRAQHCAPPWKPRVHSE